MKIIFALIVVASSVQSASAQNSHYTQGYTNSHGTYVQPHYQTNPNNTRQDNWSSQGNTNPYTGQAGTVDPYASSNRNNGSSGSNSYGTGTYGQRRY